MPVDEKKIIEARRELRERIINDLSKDNDVIAVYDGRAVDLKEDAFSGLDIRIVTTAPEFERYVSEKQERARRWGNVLFFEESGQSFPYTTAHYDFFIKVELFYLQATDLLPSISMKNIVIEHDPHDLVETVRRESQRLTYKPTPEDFEQWRGKFLAYLYEAYRRLDRNERGYADQMIDGMCWSVASGWLMRRGILPNSPINWSTYEGVHGKLTSEEQTRLKSWRNEKRGNQQLQVVSAAFLEVHEELLNQGLAKDEIDVKKVIGYVLT